MIYDLVHVPLEICEKGNGINQGIQTYLSIKSYNLRQLPGKQWIFRRPVR